jgi:hypothetical protein
MFDKRWEIFLRLFYGICAKLDVYMCFRIVFVSCGGCLGYLGRFGKSFVDLPNMITFVVSSISSQEEKVLQCLSAFSCFVRCQSDKLTTVLQICAWGNLLGIYQLTMGGG